MALDTDSVAVLTISLLEAVAGLVTSSFIVFDIMKNVFRGQAMSTRDKLLLGLSISNMVSPIILSAANACNIFLCDATDYVDVLRFTLILYSMSSCSWLTTCLCFFYYVKVMNFSSRYLSVLKKNINVLIPWMILVVEVTSLCGSFLNAMLDNPSGHSLLNAIVSTNATDHGLSPANLDDVLYLSNFVSYPLMIVTTACIMASVTRHIHRMRRNISTTESINLEAHQRVVQTMQHLVAFYVLFYLLLIIEYSIDLPGVWHKNTYKIILLTFSPVQSVILIHGNPRLKESWTKMWLCGGLRALSW